MGSLLGVLCFDSLLRPNPTQLAGYYLRRADVVGRKTGNLALQSRL